MGRCWTRGLKAYSITYFSSIFLHFYAFSYMYFAVLRLREMGKRGPQKGKGEAPTKNANRDDFFTSRGAQAGAAPLAVETEAKSSGSGHPGSSRVCKKGVWGPETLFQLLD